MAKDFREQLKKDYVILDGAMGTMLQFGSNVSREFAKSYLMKKKFADAHDEGYIHIHDMDFEAMGTTTCICIVLGNEFRSNHWEQYAGYSTYGIIRK